MPSLWEGFGLAAVEALTLGLPVVCSGAGGLCDIVNDSCGKICKTLDEYVSELVAMPTPTRRGGQALMPYDVMRSITKRTASG